MNKLLLACILLLAAVLPSPSRAAECTEVTAINYIVAGPGAYCLGNALSANTTSGFFVKIDADDVQLDCRGHSLHNANTSTNGNAYAIQLTNHRNVRIRNCLISGGFAAGIYVYQDNGMANQNSSIDISGNAVSGTYWYGIFAYGTGISIRDNRIDDIGGRASFAMGIRVGGSNVSGEPRFFVVDGNAISGVDSPGNNAYGIYANNADGSVITDNAIAGMRTHNGSYDAVGVSLLLAENTRITGNTITGTPAVEDIGIVAPASNACFDNLIRAVSTPTLSCDATHGNF